MKRACSIFMSTMILISIMFIPLRLSVSGESAAIILTAKDFIIGGANNCTVQGNTVNSTTDLYPQFFIALPDGYYAKNITITATLTKNDDHDYGSSSIAYSTIANGIQLQKSGMAIQSYGYYNQPFKLGQTLSYSMSLNETNWRTEINRIYFGGAWVTAPNSDGAFSLTFEKIEITESGYLKAEKPAISTITSSSIACDFKVNDSDLLEFRISEKTISEENFSQADLVASGTMNKAVASNLKENTQYYLGLKVTRGAKIGYAFTSAATYPETASSGIKLSSDSFKITNANGVSVSGNTIVSANSNSLQFDVVLPAPYYIKSVKIVATVENNRLNTDDSGLQLVFENETKGSLASGVQFQNGNSTRYFVIPVDLQELPVDCFRISGNWDIDSLDVNSSLTIESLEIIGKEALIAPKQIFENKTGNSVNVYWESVKDAQVEYWYSSEKLNENNFDSVSDKTLAAQGEISEVTLNDLTPRKDYYTLLKITRGEDVAYSYGKVIPQALDDEVIILDKTDFSLKGKSNCKISENVMTSTANLYPQFYVNLPSSYYIESVTVTATVFRNDSPAAADIINYRPNTNGLQLMSKNKSVQQFGNTTYASIFRQGETRTFTMSVSSENQSKAIDQILFAGQWTATPKSGAVSLQIDRVEITGSRNLGTTKMIFDKVMDNSVQVNWTVPEKTGVRLWRSDYELNMENFDSSTDKILVDDGRINIANAEGLTRGKRCYFALEILNGTKREMVYDSIIPMGAMYDFEKSTDLNDYPVKTPTRSSKGLFNFVNAGEKMSTSIVKTETYSDYGNAFELKVEEHDTTRWPMVYFYAPNWADFTGEGFTATLGKTKNSAGENISIPCKVFMMVDGCSSFYVSSENFTTSVFSATMSKKTVSFRYSDFTLNGEPETKFNASMAEHITAIGFFFQISKSMGAFSVYFDSIRVNEPIKIERQVKSLSFGNPVITSTEGDTFYQKAIFEPYNATENDLTWYSNEPEIASVNPTTGSVTALNTGIAKITATAPNGISATYKIIIKEDSRGVLYRDLFTFDNGSIPKTLTVNNANPQLDYVKSDQEISLYLKSSAKLTAEFTVNDYDFYGAGLGIWTLGNKNKSVDLELITKSGKIFIYTLLIDIEDGNFATFDYAVFREKGTNKSPTEEDILDFKKLRIIYKGSLYVDSIKVKDPLVFNQRQYPKNYLGEKDAVISNLNSLGNLKYYLSGLKSGIEYQSILNILETANLLSSDTEPAVYSLYFVDDNFIQKDLLSPVTVTLKIPFDYEGMNNLWILYIGEGEIQGVTAHIVGDKISFDASKSGVYCLVEGTDDSFLTKRIKSASTYDVMIYEGTDPEFVTKTKETIRRKKGKTIPIYSETDNSLWILWIVIPAAVLVLAGSVTAVILILKKKRNKKAGENE